MSDEPPARPAAARALGRLLFLSRWLLAPIYVGLTIALAGLVLVMIQEIVHAVSDVSLLQPKYIIVTTLSVIDVSLAANLVLIVILSGYEQFVARIETGRDEGRLGWMRGVDFAGLKLRLIASLVAISAVILLRSFMEVSEGVGGPGDRTLGWMIGIHLTFVVSGLLLAVMDFVVAKTHAAEHAPGPVEGPVARPQPPPATARLPASGPAGLAEAAGAPSAQPGLTNFSRN